MNGCLPQTLQIITKEREHFLKTQQALIDVRGVTKTYSSGQEPSLHNLSLTVHKGESLVLMGTSGSGKTTLLKLLNGLESPTCGTIYIKNQNINDYHPQDLRRSFFGYVFQKVGLFPHMTIRENLEIVFRINKISRDVWEGRLQRLLELIHLPSSFLNRYPDQLSGGEQQRIGVARALATDSECLLMDEPFGALDALTRCELQDELLTLKKELQKTIIFVTHDLIEAFKVGDRIAILRQGKLEQIGTKEDLLGSPQTPFVEQLVSKA